MTLDELKTALQRHFSDGLAIVVGSGLSCAEGLSGMGALATHLKATMPSRLHGETLQEWEAISPLIANRGLESALMEQELSDTLDATLNVAVVELLGPEENSVIAEVISGRRELRFSRLVPHLLKDGKGVPILTTNYDRLIELACEAANLPVDTMFDGAIFGRSAPREARENLLRAIGIHRGALRRELRKHARVFKPHGSLDWYEAAAGPVRFAGDLPLPRLIVTPGRRKLRRGYDAPFDEHRDTMNRLIENAARLLIIGYGFNDDHLETRITKLIVSGAPALILTRDLSSTARHIAETHPTVTAVERASKRTSRVLYKCESREINIPNLWDLGGFIDEVLKP